MSKRTPLVAKWNSAGSRWHWCTARRGTTLCGIKRLRSVGECSPSLVNRKHSCTRCVSARKAK